MPPWAPGRDGFQKIAEQAVASLNPVLARYVDGADVFISDLPGMELVADGVDPRALVLLDGFPSDDEERTEGSAPPPGRVFVYALNVVRLSGSFDAIEHEIALGLEREIGAAFLEAEQEARPQRELN
jgi:hypothetical protein